MSTYNISNNFILSQLPSLLSFCLISAFNYYMESVAKLVPVVIERVHASMAIGIGENSQIDKIKDATPLRK